MDYNYIAILMFGGMLAMLLTGQRVFAVIGRDGAVRWT